MAKAAVDLLGSQVSRGIAITKYGHSMGSIDGIKIFEAGHPLPDANSVLATSKTVEMVSGLGSDDTILFLVSAADW
jgi:hydroxypyruvate reductase